MIYFDNGATTLQKPMRVNRAVEKALNTCANPGRSGHSPAMKAAQTVFSCRMAVCELFNVPSPEQVVFTMNATHSLNLAIKSVMGEGGHAVVSGYEHNSVVRPLEAMKSRGVSYTAAYSPLFDQEAALEAIRQAIGEETVCVILNHVSNVFGFELPLAQVDALCLQKGIPLIVDASQSAGVYPIDCSALKSAVFICMPGHKGLYGPQGTGVLLCLGSCPLRSLMEGGTGSNSMELVQPEFLPDIFESGTVNVPGIAGLYEGVRFVLEKKPEGILAHEKLLTQKLAAGLGNINGVELFHDPLCQSGVLSFRSDRIDPEGLGEQLAQKGICTRAGLHCSPLAHRSAGTLEGGTLRVSFSAFNTVGEVSIFIGHVSKILRKQ